MGKKTTERKKHLEEKSKNEIRILKDNVNEAFNLESSADVSDMKMKMKMKKNEKRKKKRKSKESDYGHKSEKAQTWGECNEREEAANGSKTSLLVDGQEFRTEKELIDENIKDKYESQSKERKKVKKKHSSISMPPGNRVNVVESNANNTASTEVEADERKLDANDCDVESKNAGEKRKQKRDKDSIEVMVTNSSVNGIEAGAGEGQVDASIVNSDSPRKKRKKRKRKNDVGGEATPLETLDEGLINKSAKIVENECDGTSNLSENSTLKKKSKRVSFVEDVEVFPPPGGRINEKAAQEDGLVRGKWFSREEDEIIRNAVSNYVEAHGLGENGLYMVLHCRGKAEVRNCWKEIGAAIPWRPLKSVYIRAHNIFERDESHLWTSEELETLRKLQKEHGTDWKTMALKLNKHRIHVKDTWRRICLPNMKKGKWSQEEYQNLFDLVNMDLRMKAFHEKKSKHGMLRDNIPWTSISRQLQTRADAICCMKWYGQLTSPMVSEGKWLDTDDYRLVEALYDMDACCMEDVEWDDLVEHRSGDTCRKRWNQMVKHLGEHGNKSFPDQVEVLMQRYCPELLESREAYDSKPAVD